MPLEDTLAELTNALDNQDAYEAWLHIHSLKPQKANKNTK
jgi:hypothetical protein